MFEKLNSTLNNVVIVTDMDEVLTDISPVWVKMIYQNRDYFEKYFNLDYDFKGKSVDDLDPFNEDWRDYVLGRKQFRINEWLLKKDVEFSEEELKEVNDKFFELYDNDLFYDNCEPTKLAESIYLLSLQNWSSKIYILTRTSDNTKDGKNRFVENFLMSSQNSAHKFELIFVGKDEKKSDYLNKLGKVNIVIDDELSNIHDFLDNCKFNETDLYIPLTGYNEPDLEFFEKCDETEGLQVNFYEIMQQTRKELDAQPNSI